MPTFHVPVENRRTSEWEIVAIDAPCVVTAMYAVRAARKGSWLKVWAAVRERPTIEQMIDLRRSFNACGYGIGGPKVAARRLAQGEAA